MKKKKRIITIAGLLLIAVIGATFAYYTSNTSFENVFNAGKYKVTLTEEFVSPDNWVPGETIPKTVTAKNEGTVPAVVRISYTEQWLKEIDGVETDITSQVSPNPAIINFDNQGDWTSSNGYYYYKYILEPTDETSSFISGVTLDPNLNSVTCTGEGNTKTCETQNPASGAKYKLTFTIQTIQYDVYKSEWNTDINIFAAQHDPELVSYNLSDTCPNCVYSDLELSINDTVSQEDYDNYFYDTYESMGWYSTFGYVLENNVVKRIFNCAGTENQEDNVSFCLEGYDASKYEKNKQILRHYYPICDLSGDSSYCWQEYDEESGQSIGIDTYSIYADNLGRVYIDGHDGAYIDEEGNAVWGYPEWRQ